MRSQGASNEGISASEHVRFAGGGDEVVDGTPSLPKGRVNREHAFEEAATVFGGLPPIVQEPALCVSG